MASLTRQSSRGKIGYRIQFVPPKASPNDPRVSLSLGEVDVEFARTFVSFTELIVEDIAKDRAHDRRTREWLKKLDDVLHAKIAKHGLCESRAQVVVQPAEDRSLRTLVDRFLKTVTKKEPATQTKLRQAGDCLIRYFTGERDVATITAGDAVEWSSSIANSGNIRAGRKRKDRDGNQVQGKTTLSDNTVRRRAGLSKQIFEFAVMLRWITENPFVGLVASVQANEDRMFLSIIRQSRR